jgi:pimeloyl-ACP methyl ester carboxylesterase
VSLAPPVLLVHGFGSSFRHGWVEPGWVDLLADAGREVIGLDLPGHGSAPAPRPHVADDELELAVESVLPDDRVVDAVGFSLGAHVLLRVAARDATRFRRMVLIGVGENVFRHDDPSPLATALSAGSVDETDIRARVFLELARSAGNDPVALAACLTRPRRPLTADELSRVRVPVLVIIGEHDFAGPPEPLVTALPDARLRVLRGIDHFQAPRDFACLDAALNFLGV